MTVMTPALALMPALELVPVLELVLLLMLGLRLRPVPGLTDQTTCSRRS